jgi:hypothetical protein
MANAYEGSYAACMKDSYKQQFHHDWARNKGSAHLTFKFMPPSSGCYTIEEYHPGSTYACSRYLPSNAFLEIEYQGGRKPLFINQAVNGAQWNEIGSFMFSEGKEGRLTMRSSPEEKCADNCFWVADAFRLTWKGHQCTASPTVAVVQSATEDSSPSTRGAASTTVLQTSPAGHGHDQHDHDHAPYANPPSMSQSALATSAEGKKACGDKGMLLFRAKLGQGEDSESVRLMIQEKKCALEATLAWNLGYKEVSILDIVVSGRRLLGQDVASLKIHFSAREKIANPVQANLVQAFQAHLGSSRVAVESIDLQWLKVGSHTTDEPETDLLLYVGLASAMLIFLGIATFIFWKCRTSRRTSKLDNEGNPSSVEVAPVKEELDEGEKAKKMEEADTASVSTGTPASDGKSIEEILFGSAPTDDDTISQDLSVTKSDPKDLKATEVVVEFAEEDDVAHEDVAQSQENTSEGAAYLM